MENITETTVIVPAYDEAEYMTSVLSVLRNDDPNSEIIVVDDGTVSQVQDAANLDKRIRLISHYGVGQRIRERIQMYFQIASA
jgi:glycosyltransferase involved in cell wall biosynthesis